MLDGVFGHIYYTSVGIRAAWNKHVRVRLLPGMSPHPRGGYIACVEPTSNRWFWTILAIALVPIGGVAFALARAAHDIRLALAEAPAPVAGVCRQTIVYTLDPLAHVTYVVFAAVAVLAIVLGVSGAASSHAGARRALRTYGAIGPGPERLTRLAQKAGIKRVRAINSPRPLAFAFGYVRPAVAISDGLADALDDDELLAVLFHESEHVLRRDPLRMLIVAAVSRALTFAPLVGSLAERFKEAKEIDADRAVISAMGSRQPLVSALLSAGSLELPGSAVGFSDALAARVSALEGEEPAHVELGWRPITGTVVAVIVLTVGLFVIATGAIDAHALHVCA